MVNIFLNMTSTFFLYCVVCNLAADPMYEPGYQYKKSKEYIYIYIYAYIYTYIYKQKSNYSNICYSVIKSAIYKNEMTGFCLPLRHFKLTPWN